VVQPKVPTGRVQRDKFTSKVLGNERPIWIYTPHGYAADKKPYGLLVLTDGGLYVNTARVATTLDNLIAAGVIPPLVAVMVENPNRGRELSCSSAYAVHYTEFNGNHGLLNWSGTLASHLIALIGIKPEPKISERDRTLTARSLIPKKAIAISQVKVPPALLRQYVGRYELDPKFAHDFVLYVSVKDDFLWVKPSYLRQRPVIAESNSGFRDSEIPDLHLAFVRDERGRVTGLTLNTGQGDVLVKKMQPPVPSLTGNTTFTLAGHTDAEAVAIY